MPQRRPERYSRMLCVLDALEATDWLGKARNWRILARFSRSCGGTAQRAGCAFYLTALEMSEVRVEEMITSKRRSKPDPGHHQDSAMARIRVADGRRTATKADSS
jgi:hypothetical protein